MTGSASIIDVDVKKISTGACSRGSGTQVKSKRRVRPTRKLTLAGTDGRQAGDLVSKLSSMKWS